MFMDYMSYPRSKTHNIGYLLRQIAWQREAVCWGTTPGAREVRPGTSNEWLIHFVWTRRARSEAQWVHPTGARCTIAPIETAF